MSTSDGAGVVWGQSVIRGSRRSLPPSQPVQFLFVLDASPSMEDKVDADLSELTKWQALKQTMTETMDTLNSFANPDNFIVSVVLFSSGAWVGKKQSSPSDVRAMRFTFAKAKGLLKYGGTAMGKGIRLAEKVSEEVHANLKGQVNPKCAFFDLSDGGENMGSCPLEAAEELKSKGHLMFTIAFGESADRKLLKKMASKPEFFGEAHDLSSLINTFKSATRTASRTLGVI